MPIEPPKIEVKEVFIPAFIVEWMPRVEGALRVMQESTDMSRSKTMDTGRSLEETLKEVHAMKEIFLGFERTIKTVAGLSDRITRFGLIEKIDQVRLEGPDESLIGRGHPKAIHDGSGN
jgi:hypothetical protein